MHHIRGRRINSDFTQNIETNILIYNVPELSSIKINLLIIRRLEKYESARWKQEKRDEAYMSMLNKHQGKSEENDKRAIITILL
jgi:dihydrodipicolinate synthase/N-acetylneuraminate lyase